MLRSSNLAGLLQKGGNEIKPDDRAAPCGQRIGNSPVSTGQVEHRHAWMRVEEFPDDRNLLFNLLWKDVLRKEIVIVIGRKDLFGIEARIVHRVLSLPRSRGVAASDALVVPLPR